VKKTFKNVLIRACTIHHKTKRFFGGGKYTPLAIARDPEVTGVWNFSYKSFKPFFNKFHDIDFYRVSCKINSELFVSYFIKNIII